MPRLNAGSRSVSPRSDRPSNSISARPSLMRARRRWRKKKMLRLQPPRLNRNQMNPNRLNPLRVQLGRAEAPSPPATQLFTISSSATAIGLRRAITDMFSIRAKRKVRAVGGPTRMVAGFIPTRAGPGFRKSRLVGRLIITDAGHGCAGSVGFGSRAINGRQRGFPGARVTTTSVGRRCRRRRVSISGPAFATGRTIIMMLARTSIVLSRAGSSARRECSRRFCRQNAMSPSSIRQRMSPTSLTTRQPSSMKGRAMMNCAQ